LFFILGFIRKNNPVLSFFGQHLKAYTHGGVPRVTGVAVFGAGYVGTCN